MANPFLGNVGTNIPAYATDQYGENSDFFPGCNLHVAGLLLFALVVITAMKLAGFRAMIGIGRG